MKNTNVTSRQLTKAFVNKGFTYQRQTGSHAIYSNGKQTVAVPVVNLNPCIAKRLIKEYGLEVS